MCDVPEQEEAAKNPDVENCKDSCIYIRYSTGDDAVQGKRTWGTNADSCIHTGPGAKLPLQLYASFSRSRKSLFELVSREAHSFTIQPSSLVVTYHLNPNHNKEEKTHQSKRFAP